ncbi:Sterol uptake control protein 2-like protein 1 [Colletotrichum musicola]|uniref:Sterol uptake control protein 2-like protein 1 n=1 Tax=Colletotrichum musicola TaxID=2175873 RepID=A0A8H6U8D4_9PEZI|nr:Sterol uptake control protein 2-like protein 1 [Colletotrichum musicola]
MSPNQPTRSPEESPEEHRPPKRRKPHKKSRTGCLDCRKRRVKCSEERPSCRSCVRRQVACEYPEETQVPSDETPDVLNEVPQSRPSPGDPFFIPNRSRPFPRAVASHTSTPGTGSVTSPQTSPSVLLNFGIRDLELLHHWTVFTSVNIYKTPGIDSFWQTTLPQIGFQHPFVAHAILSLAALHLAYLDGSQKMACIIEATQHHEVAIAGFHECLANLTDEKSEALLAWSILNLFYVFGVSGHSDSAERNSPRLRKDRLLGVEWIPMVRGIDAVLGPYYDALRDGRMKPILHLGNWEELDPEELVSDPVDQELCRLRGAWENSSDAEIYEQSLLMMRKCRMYTTQFDTMDEQTQMLYDWGCNRAWAGPMAFIHFAPQQYFTLLHQRQPPSLVLFAYFGAFLRMLDDHWYFRGWGKDIVEVVDEFLGSYWRPWIRWPLQLVGLDDTETI